jgi:D-sedoheptulose 7-phosphate isomerase
MTDFSLQIKEAFKEANAVFSKIAEDRDLLEKISSAINLCVGAIQSGGTIFFGGNGGSAAESQHLAGELVSRFYYDRPAMRSVALNADTAILTAIGNDYGYDRSLARPLEALARPGDVLVALSTSGQSTNIWTALMSARSLGVHTIGLTGRDGGKMPPLCDIELRVPSDSTPRIQEAHLIIGHLLCQGIEAAIYPQT